MVMYQVMPISFWNLTEVLKSSVIIIINHTVSIFCKDVFLDKLLVTLESKIFLYVKMYPANIS